MFLARDAFVRTNRRAIAIMFVRLSGTACIVILRWTLALILLYVWIVQCPGYPDTKACPPTPSRLFPVPSGREVGYEYGGTDMQTRRDISRTVEDRG